MVSKTISISEDAYRRLRRLKRGKESFSEVIARLTGRGDLCRFAGSISGSFAAELRGASEEFRRRFEKDARRRT